MSAMRWIYYLLASAVEMIAVWSYYDQILESKRPQWANWLSFSTVYLLLMFVRNAAPVWMCISYFAANTLLLFFNYRSKGAIGVFQAGYAMYLLFAVRVLAALLVVYTRAEWEHAAQALSGNYEFTVVYGVAFYFLLQISTRYFRLPEASHWNGNAMIALIILPLVAAWITTEMVYGMMVKADGTAGDILLTACIVLLLFLGFVVFAVYAYVQKAAGERLALELQIQKERANAEYYSMLNEQYTNQRILVHDTSRHLQSIKNLLSENDSPALMEYVAEMEKEVHSQQMVRLCDNAVLNAILFRHAEFCRQNGIEYSFDIREHAVDSMTAVDITALFDNLLSNAAEAAIQAEKRFMELSAVRDDVSLLITLVNACDTPPETDGSGALVTGKSDKNSHGIGMKSIARVVKKYGGVSDFYYNPDERQFHMVIHIPLL